MDVRRIEVFIDDRDVPIQILDRPPFRLRLDTAPLTDGDHRLRILTSLSSGQQVVRTIPFRVDNVPHLAIEGLEEGAVVRGSVDLAVRLAQLPPPRRHSFWAYFAPAVLILGGVWGLFALIAPPVAPPTSGHAPTALRPTLMAEGRQLYTLHCVNCHQTNGQGFPKLIPPLAGNPALKDLHRIVRFVHSGHAGKIVVAGHAFDRKMPAIGAGFTSPQLAAVATYVRNSWGNHFGPVTAEQVSDILSTLSGSGK